MPQNLNEQTKSNLKQLNIEVYPMTTGEMVDMVPELGYESLGYGTTYDDGTEGILMQLPKEHSKFNNGIYMLHKLLDGSIVMEVIVANDKDKGSLIQQFVDTVTTAIDGFDTSDMNTFDYNEAFGFIIAKTVIKDLSKSLFPKDSEKQERFMLLYLPRFLATTAYLYTGTNNVMEEAVNSEPYVLKLAIDKATLESLNSNSSSNTNKTEDNSNVTSKD